MPPARADRASGGVGPRLVVSWQARQARRCGWCGRYLRCGAEAGHGWGLAFCEPCFLGQERRRAALWARAVGVARPVALRGAA